MINGLDKSSLDSNQHVVIVTCSEQDQRQQQQRMIITRVVRTRFWLSPSKSRIRPFFGNLAKSNSCQISSWICRTLVQLQYVQLITDKIITAVLSRGGLAILIGVTQTKKYEIHCCSTNLVKNWQTVT